MIRLNDQRDLERELKHKISELEEENQWLRDEIDDLNIIEDSVAEDYKDLQREIASTAEKILGKVPDYHHTVELLYCVEKEVKRLRVLVKEAYIEAADSLDTYSTANRWEYSKAKEALGVGGGTNDT